MNHFRDPFQIHHSSPLAEPILIAPIDDRSVTVESETGFSSALEYAWTELLKRRKPAPLKRNASALHPLTLPLAYEIDGEALGAALALLKRSRAQEAYGLSAAEDFPESADSPH